MAFHRSDANAEVAGNFLVGFAFSDALEHIQLSIGEIVWIAGRFLAIVFQRIKRNIFRDIEATGGDRGNG